jgi:hypothetical protein
MEEMRSASTVFVRKNKGKRLPGDIGKDVNMRLTCIFKELMCGCANWIHLTQNRDC